MKEHRTRMGMWACLIVASCTCLYVGSTGSPAEGDEKEVFRDEPQARALYDGMIAALQQPQTLSYKSDYHLERGGREMGHCTYTVWLKKPNQFRLEGVRVDRRGGGTLVGDGENLWLFWSGDRPRFAREDDETYNKTRSNVYMKKPAPPGGYSISEETGHLPIGMTEPVLDPSVFHGHTGLLPPLDGVMGRGVEKVGDEECDMVELRPVQPGTEIVRDVERGTARMGLAGPRENWYLWLSRKDHLPRKLIRTIQVSEEIVIHEVWSNIVTDEPIPAEKFAWMPPKGWRQWEIPSAGSVLLKPGTPAPDFELSLADGKKVKLSGFRGKIVWLYTWHGRSLALGAQIRDLQEFYEKHSDKGLVILGFNCWDDRQAAREFFQQNGATFPTILASSEAAQIVYFVDYKGTGLPLNYIIDRQGKIVDAWIGSVKVASPRYDKGHERALAALKKAGLETEG